MCEICGCSDDSLEHHQHLQHHTHDEHVVDVGQSILAKNQQFALENKKFLEKKSIVAINIMSSPGSGKTTLIAKTIQDLKSQMDITVIVGDQHTNQDAQLINKSGGSALQINTGKVCHLDAHMIGHALQDLDLKNKSLLFIENIGNLVCPALFNLGESYKVVLISVPEGDNKPIKYPDMFRGADLIIINKTDLLPYVSFDVAQCKQYALSIKPDVDIITLSTTNGTGLDEWYQWLKQKIAPK